MARRGGKTTRTGTPRKQPPRRAVSNTTKKKLRAAAKARPRDAFGRFLPKGYGAPKPPPKRGPGGRFVAKPGGRVSLRQTKKRPRFRFDPNEILFDLEGVTMAFGDIESSAVEVVDPNLSSRFHKYSITVDSVMEIEDSAEVFALWKPILEPFYRGRTVLLVHTVELDRSRRKKSPHWYSLNFGVDFGEVFDEGTLEALTKDIGRADKPSGEAEYVDGWGIWVEEKSLYERP